jgi:hypothetical protein
MEPSSQQIVQSLIDFLRIVGWTAACLFLGLVAWWTIRALRYR